MTKKIAHFVWVQGAENDAYWNPIKDTIVSYEDDDTPKALRQCDELFDEWIAKREIEWTRNHQGSFLNTHRFMIDFLA